MHSLNASIKFDMGAPLVQCYVVDVLLPALNGNYVFDNEAA